MLRNLLINFTQCCVGNNFRFSYLEYLEILGCSKSFFLKVVLKVMRAKRILWQLEDATEDKDENI